MVQRVATFRNRRYNGYVPAAGFAHDVSEAGPYQVDYGNPIVANAASILSAQSIATAGVASGLVGTTPLLLDTLTDTFGRNLQVVASGAATSAVTIRGRDYLGQPMVELFTLNGATPVVGNKAFKWIDSVTYAATAATTITVGTGAKFGVPYYMTRLIGEEAAGQPTAAGTFVAGVNTDPGTSITGDPRGTYVPTTVPNGATRIRVTYLANNLLNASGNGGLYGIAHFYS